MNINELFFLKVFSCQNKNCLNQNFCYYFHKHERDRRRLLIDFLFYFNNKNCEDIKLNNSNHIQLKNDLKIYHFETGFTDEYLQKIYCKFENCKNIWEKNFHILNYYEKNCKFDDKEFLIECPNKLFCSDLHLEGKNKGKLQFNFFPEFKELGNYLKLNDIFLYIFSSILYLFF